MPSGKGALDVSLKEVKVTAYTPALVSDLKPGKYLKLTVSDTGTGISPEIRDRIFDPFFTTRRSGTGTGLGLAVVHEVVKNANGSIILASEVGKGTRYEIYFPKCHEAESPAPAPGRRPSVQGDMHILLADDNAADLRSIHQLLLRLGHRVTSASDPREALDIFSQDPEGFSLVITDQVMPRMRGHELAMQIHRIRADIPVILCSGSEEVLRELQEKETAVDAFILKPFSRSELEDAIGRVMIP
jgi:CheY-like chemotaxis protein